MITTNDIKSILLNEVKSNFSFSGIIVTKDVHAPVTEENNFERIVIVLPGGTSNGVLSVSLPRICFYVPDILDTGINGAYYRPNTGRLSELEQFCINSYKCGKSGAYNGWTFYYSIENITQDPDPETWSHFINMQLIFKVVSKNEVK